MIAPSDGTAEDLRPGEKKKGRFLRRIPSARRFNTPAALLRLHLLTVKQSGLESRCFDKGRFACLSHADIRGANPIRGAAHLCRVMRDGDAEGCRTGQRGSSLLAKSSSRKGVAAFLLRCNWMILSVCLSLSDKMSATFSQLRRQHTAIFK